MKIGIVQLISDDNYKANLANVLKHIQSITITGAKLVVLPEYGLRYGNHNCPTLEEQNIFLNDMSEIAKKYDIWLVAGSYPLQGSPQSKPYSACCVFNNTGHLVAQYNKINLFDAVISEGKETYRESNYYKHGEQIVIVDSPWGKLGIAICFDLRFPALFSQFANHGCKIIIIPAAFTNTTGAAHWQILVRARAIETQSYVVAVNQGGLHFNNSETWGGSTIVNPWGEILASLDKGEGILTESLDLSMVEKTKLKIPQTHGYYPVSLK